MITDKIHMLLNECRAQRGAINAIRDHVAYLRQTAQQIRSHNQQQGQNQHNFAAPLNIPASVGANGVDLASINAILPNILAEVRANGIELVSIEGATRLINETTQTSLEQQRETIAEIRGSRSPVYALVKRADMIIFCIIVFALGVFIAFLTRGHQQSGSIPLNDADLEQAAKKAATVLGNILGQNSQWNTFITPLGRAGPSSTSAWRG